MKKIIIIVILAIILLPCIFVARRLIVNPIRITPYPYKITRKSWKEIERISPNTILLTGDQSSAMLFPFLGTVSENISQKLRNALTIKDITRKNEGIHRTLGKIKKIKDLPAVIIYAASGSELLEQKIKANSFKTFKSNLNIYNNAYLRTLIELYPRSSQLLYKPSPRLVLKEEIKKVKLGEKLSSISEYIKLSYFLYKIQLSDLVKYTIDSGSEIILITTPINYDIPPVKNCPQSGGGEITELNNILVKRIEQGNLKSLKEEVSRLELMNMSNALSFWTLGQYYKSKGLIQKGKEYLKKSNAFDCNIEYHPSEIANQITREVAKELQVPLIDFSRTIDQNNDETTPFLIEHQPQDIYLEKLIDQIIWEIKNSLNIN